MDTSYLASPRAFRFRMGVGIASSADQNNTTGQINYVHYYNFTADKLTSNQSYLMQGRIAATHSRIRRVVAPMCSPIFYNGSLNPRPWLCPFFVAASVRQFCKAHWYAPHISLQTDTRTTKRLTSVEIGRIYVRPVYAMRPINSTDRRCLEGCWSLEAKFCPRPRTRGFNLSELMQTFDANKSVSCKRMPWHSCLYSIKSWLCCHTDNDHVLNSTESL